MKKLLLTTAMVLGLAGVAFGQGSILLQNQTLLVVGVQDTTPGNWYDDGAFHLEVWGMNGGAVPGGINNAPSSAAAYDAMVGAGFTLQSGGHNNIMNAGNAGVFNFGSVTLPGVNAPSGVLALVGWAGNFATWQEAANAGALGGVVAFVNPLGNPLSEPPGSPAELTGWDNSGNQLLMTIIPEPSTLTLAGLGLAAVLGLRRRK
jgi:hypothetical protein